MEPAFQRGDLLVLAMTNRRVEVGDICVYKIRGRDIPIVHRALKVHDKYVCFWSWWRRRRRGGGVGRVRPVVVLTDVSIVTDIFVTRSISRSLLMSSSSSHLIVGNPSTIYQPHITYHRAHYPFHSAHSPLPPPSTEQ